MSFNEKLNKYLTEFKISSKQLSEISGISESVISRYRSGKRIPKTDSDNFNSIVDAFFNISTKTDKSYTKEHIHKDLSLSITSLDDFDYDSFSKNLNNLISILNINTKDMSKYIVFDASHISRIKNGKTKPSDPKDFSTKVANYIVYKYNSPIYKDLLLTVLDTTEYEINTSDKLFHKIYDYLVSNYHTKDKNYINDFLTNLDKFDLNDYIKAIKFDELKVPSLPFYIVKSKNYYGVEEMKKGELDFFKATVLSKSMEDVFMCSDMPMEDMAKDLDFGKKWMFAIAMSLKKGLHLNIIHNLDRPFNEMMLGLESWIPIYMTGQISPYYLKEVKNSVYNHLNYVSGGVALTGECINGSHDKGKYYLTSNNKELVYYKEKASLLLKKANPLMEIYREDNKSAFKAFLINDSELILDRKRIFSSLPLFTISDELLIKILNDNNISQDDINTIIEYKKEEKEYMTSILTNCTITDVIYKPTMEEFLDDSIALSTENIFYDKKIKYTYEDFIKHFELTIKYSNINKNYKVITSSYKTFKNINITMVGKHHVILSKSANPIIHFVIKHPKLVDAIVNFNPLVIE